MEEDIPEAEKVPDLLVFGLCRDVLNVNSGSRHGECLLRQSFEKGASNEGTVF